MNDTEAQNSSSTSSINNSSNVVINQTDKATSGFENLQVDFEKKILIAFVIWFCLNLILIRVTWRIYGPRVAEFFIKESDYCEDPNQSKLNKLFSFKYSERSFIELLLIFKKYHTDQNITFYRKFG